MSLRRDASSTDLHLCNYFFFPSPMPLTHRGPSYLALILVVCWAVLPWSGHYSEPDRASHHPLRLVRLEVASYN